MNTVVTEWTESHSIRVRKTSEVHRAPHDIIPGWQAEDQHNWYWVYEPGFVRPDCGWVAAWMRKSSRAPGFDGYLEADALEQTVTNWPYAMAKQFLDAVEAHGHGAAKYDHEGCRCGICKHAKALRQKKYRQQQAGS